MKTTLADKLAASVREAKQQQTSTEKPVTQTAEPVKAEAQAKQVPAKRVWPD